MTGLSGDDALGRCIYRLDAFDRIIAVDEGWHELALSHDAPGAFAPEVLGRSIWRFVAGQETECYLNAIFFWCRRTGRSVELPYRCDTPLERRWWTMRVSGAEDYGLEIRHEEKDRLPAPLSGLVRRSGNAARQLCSICCRGEMDGVWMEGVGYAGRRKPAEVYTVCPTCRRAAAEGLGMAARPCAPAAEGRKDASRPEGGKGAVSGGAGA